MIETAVAEFPNFKVVATTLRNARTASINDWGAICWAGGEFFLAPTREALEIWDRVGGGDSFASGLIYGFLTGRGPQWAVECGAAHGALAMTTPGRHEHGDAGRSRARDERRHRPRRAVSDAVGWLGAVGLCSRPWARGASVRVGMYRPVPLCIVHCAS